MFAFPLVDLMFGGEEVDKDFHNELQRRLHSLLAPLYSSRSCFPGAQPVSFARSHLSSLLRHDYYVCEKSDGLRYLLHLAQPPGGLAAFLIDRNWHILSFPGFGLMNREHSPESLHSDTLLDGELVDGRFLIFDILLLNGKPTWGMELPDRLAKIQNHVIEPFEFMCKEVVGYECPFKLSLKIMYKSYGIKELLDQVIPQQAHPNDGLIFTPVHETYRAGTWPSLLKWKPADMNTVDFKVGEREVSKGTFELLIGEQRRPVYYCQSRDANLADHLGKIVECRLIGKDEWVFVRERPDKPLPNDISVAQKVIESIMDNIGKEDLYNILDQIYKNWKARELGYSTPHDKAASVTLEWKSFEEYDDHVAEQHEHHGPGKKSKREDDAEASIDAPLDY